MPKTLARLTFVFLAAAALAACGSSSSPPADGGPVADGGGVVPDGGPVADAGCTAATCETQVGGNYTVCVNCGAIGTFNLNATLENTCGCAVKGCVQTDGGQSCGTGTVEPQHDGGPYVSAAFPVPVGGATVTATCTGHYISGGVADLACTAAGGAVNCSGAIKPNFGQTCP